MQREPTEIALVQLHASASRLLPGHSIRRYEMLRPAYAQGPKGLLHLISTAAPRSRILECHIFGARCRVQPAACRHKFIATTSRRGARGADSCASLLHNEAYTSVHFGDDLFVLRRSRTGHAHGAGDGIGGGRTGRVGPRRRRAHRGLQDAAATRHNQREHRATPTWFGLQRERRSRGSLQDCTRTPTWLPTTPRATSRPRQDPSSRSPGQTVPLNVQFTLQPAGFNYFCFSRFGPGKWALFLVTLQPGTFRAITARRGHARYRSATDEETSLRALLRWRQRRRGCSGMALAR